MISAPISHVPSLDEAITFRPQQIVELARSQVTLCQEVQTLKHQLDWFKRQIFGQKSERRIIHGADGQMSLGEAIDREQTAPPAPVGVIEGSRADVSFVAGLLIDKLAYHCRSTASTSVSLSGITVSLPNGSMHLNLYQFHGQQRPLPRFLVAAISLPLLL